MPTTPASVATLRPPVAVRRVELAGDTPDLDLRREGTPYRSALLVPTVHNRPLGTVAIALGDPRLDARAAREAIARELAVPATNGARRGRAAPALPSVSVVIATCNDAAGILRAVASVLDGEVAPLEVLVVENRPAGSAVAAALAARFGEDDRVHCLAEARRGLGWARNAGLAAARGEVVAFTDDDVTVDPGWVAAIARAFAAEPDAACVTGLILPGDVETDAQLRVEQYAGWGKGFERRVFRADEPTGPLFPYAAGEFGSGANIAVRAGVARASGGFDPALGAGTIACGSEDLDLFVRTLLDGHHLVYEPAAMVFHAAPDTPGALRSEVFRYGVSLAAVITKLAAEGHLREILRRLPAAARFLRDPSSRKNAGKPRDYPWRLELVELAGMAAGPVAYAISRRRTRRLEAR